MDTSSARLFAARREPPGLALEIAEFLQHLAKTLFDPYRPELHYMRGPGPKWHAKHDRVSAALDAQPALVRLRARR